jgi:hypothetical protein
MVKASLLFFERIISQKTGGHKAHRSDDYLLEISFQQALQCLAVASLVTSHLNELGTHGTQ